MDNEQEFWDRCAAAALQGEIVSYANYDGHRYPDASEFAKASAKKADAMLEERRKRAAESPASEFEGISLGALIEALRGMPQDKSLYIDSPFELVPTNLGSYRGDYADLAVQFVASGPPLAVRNFLRLLESAVGMRFEGYKGGFYEMSEASAVWVSGYGKTSGMRVTGVRDDGWCVVITIAKEEP